MGHRNIYYRDNKGPVVRSTDPKYDTLDKLNAVAREQNALIIPHHSANVVMGCDWSLGHDAEHERLVEIHSVWGSSECSEQDGNPIPIALNKGEKKGQHVFDALNLGRRLGIIGGGDIHDGRPGDDLHRFLGHAGAAFVKRQGIMGVWSESLTRESIFDALWNRRVYATTNNRTFLKFSLAGQPMGGEVSMAKKMPVSIYAASDSPIARVDLVCNGKDIHTIEPNQREATIEMDISSENAESWYMARVTRQDGGMAWSSPVWTT